MSAGEHECSNCFYSWMDNKYWNYCPKCGHKGTVTNWSDEYGDEDLNPEENEDEDEVEELDLG